MLLSFKADSTAYGHQKPSDLPWYVRLWAAVIRRAAVDYVLYRDHDTVKLKKIGLEAEQWIFSDDDSGDVGDFRCACDILNLDPDLVRDRIGSLTEEAARRLRGMEFGDD